MIGVSCAIRVLGGGLHAYGLSVFFLPVTQELGLTRTATSLVFSLARAQGAIEGPIAGYCIDRFGPRPVITIAVALAGIGYLLLAGVHSYAMLLIVYMGIISLSLPSRLYGRDDGGGQHLVYSQAGSGNVDHQRVDRSRRRPAHTLVSVCSSHLGLAHRLHRLGHSVPIWPAFRIVAADSPLAGKSRLLPDGAPFDMKTRATVPSIALDKAHANPNTPCARRFVRHSFGCSRSPPVSAPSVRARVLVHFVPIMVWKGYSEPQGAFYLGVIAFCGMPTHLLIGWLGDCVYKPRLMAGFMVLGSLSVYLLFNGTQAWQLWLAVLLFSVFEGLFPVTWATVGDFFGRKNFAKIRGSMSFLYTWGSVLGPVIAGSIYDRTNSYAALFWILIITCWVTAALYAALFQPKPRTPGD